MRTALRAVWQMMLMAAIVATLLFVPLGAVLALALSLFSVSVHDLLTFGGVLGIAAGVVAWWLIAFAAALTYAAFVFPWDVKHGFPKL